MLEHAVDGVQQLAHDRDDDLERLLAASDELLAEGSDVRFVVTRSQRGHVERGA